MWSICLIVAIRIFHQLYGTPISYRIESACVFLIGIQVIAVNVNASYIVGKQTIDYSMSPRNIQFIARLGREQRETETLDPKPETRINLDVKNESHIPGC